MTDCQAELKQIMTTWNLGNGSKDTEAMCWCKLEDDEYGWINIRLIRDFK